MSDRPWLTIILPTAGRRLAGLARALDSIAGQRSPLWQWGDRPAEGVEVLVVGDTHSAPLPEVERLVWARGHRYLGHDGGLHAWGQPQRQAGMERARGEWVLFGADDDILTPTALAEIRKAISHLDTPRPLVFRFVAPPALHRLVIPVSADLRAGNVDASCLVVPNVLHRLGRWENTYEGDHAFLASTAALWGGPASIRWCAPIISFARPDPTDDWPRFWRRAADGARVRVNVGCGAFPLPNDGPDGWINIDSSRNATAADLHLSVPPLPFPDDTVAEVYAGHVLEHMRPDLAHAFLQECLRVLRPGGKLGVVVPDTRLIMTRWLAGAADIVEAPEGHFHRIDDLDHVNRLFLFSTYQESPHLWAYDAATLSRALVDAGFEVTGEINRYDDPRIPVHVWYGCGWDAVKPMGALRD